MKYSDIKENIKDLFKAPLPGEAFQLKMAPSGIKRIPAVDNILNAAVLILIFPINNIAHIGFIKRAEYPGIHSGQIALPGGREEVSDLNLENTALRETFEEVGIKESEITIISKLTPLFIPVSGYKVFPFVGIIDKTPEWILDKQEVSYVIEAPLEDLLNPNNIKSENKKINGYEIDVPYYNIKGEIIWGATAMIMCEFLEIIRRSKP